MSIISSLPFTLVNGQTADATQVMANFNTIVSGVNSSAAANGANSDITSLSGLTTPLAVSEGGTGAATLAGANIVTNTGASVADHVPKFSGVTGKVITDGYAVGTAASSLVQLTAAALLPAVGPTLSLDTLGAVQGDIAYRNATVWTVLAPGTAGQALLSGGPAANPSWGSGGPFSSTLFTSADQTITTAGALTLAHGLGTTPKFILGTLVCTTGEFNYTAGDTLPIAFPCQRQTNDGASVVPDATNLNVRFGSAGQVFGGLDKTTGAAVSFTNANWNIRFFAWA